jgi:hypothetical protein
MNISEEQVKAVVRVLEENEYRLSDGYEHYYFYDKKYNYRPDNLTGEDLKKFDLNLVLQEVAIDVINKLNEVIYKGT